MEYSMEDGVNNWPHILVWNVVISNCVGQHDVFDGLEYPNTFWIEFNEIKMMSINKGISLSYLMSISQQSFFFELTLTIKPSNFSKAFISFLKKKNWKIKKLKK